MIQSHTERLIFLKTIYRTVRCLQYRKNTLSQHTAAAASTTQRGQEDSSDSNSDSNTSDIIRRKIHITTEKKKREERNSPILASISQPIPFNINMVDFDAKLLKVVYVWLGGSSAIMTYV